MERPQRLRARSEIRQRLETNRAWSLYALADLDDGMFEQCDWWGLGDGLALVFRGLSIRPIFVLGDIETTRQLLAAVPDEWGYLNIRASELPAVEGIYRFRERHEMYRMMLDRGAAIAGGESVETLTPAHVDEVQALFATGDGGGIAFAPFQLANGLFRGIRRSGDLVAIAGVHAVSTRESVAGLGNVFTRPDCRGQGLAQRATSAVVAALRDSGIREIGLNVERGNVPAVRAYERLGFRTIVEYYDGPVDRAVAP